MNLVHTRRMIPHVQSSLKLVGVFVVFSIVSCSSNPPSEPSPPTIPPVPAGAISCSGWEQVGMEPYDYSVLLSYAYWMEPADSSNATLEVGQLTANWFDTLYLRRTGNDWHFTPPDSRAADTAPLFVHVTADSVFVEFGIQGEPYLYLLKKLK